MRPWRPPFQASPAARKGPISSKRVSSQDPLLRKFGNFSLYSLNFHPNFSSQASKFGNFQLTSLKFGKFPLASPPFQRQMSVRKPHTSEIRAAHPYLKKSWVPPPPGSQDNMLDAISATMTSAAKGSAGNKITDYMLPASLAAQATPPNARTVV